MDMFREEAKKDGKTLNALCHALQRGNAEEAQLQLRKYLKKTISIRDTAVRTDMKEDFYHGVLFGILGVKA